MLEERRLDTKAWVTDRTALGEVPRQVKNLSSRRNRIKAIVDGEEAGGSTPNGATRSQTTNPAIGIKW